MTQGGRAQSISCADCRCQHGCTRCTAHRQTHALRARLHQPAIARAAQLPRTHPHEAPRGARALGIVLDVSMHCLELLVQPRPPFLISFAIPIGHNFRRHPSSLRRGQRFQLWRLRRRWRIQGQWNNLLWRNPHSRTVGHIAQGRCQTFVPENGRRGFRRHSCATRHLAGSGQRGCLGTAHL